ncbi:unnamed protein product [Polarella glacialis]|uniref:Uncharacterized protein n=1 Tax=Polarella glacialis TaxID=89957 RepID=A0A813KRW8_POLGL|nr:unnamed protein product [Polarella glacialis]
MFLLTPQVQKSLARAPLGSFSKSLRDVAAGVEARLTQMKQEDFSIFAACRVCPGNKTLCARCARRFARLPGGVPSVLGGVLGGVLVCWAVCLVCPVCLAVCWCAGLCAGVPAGVLVCWAVCPVYKYKYRYKYKYKYKFPNSGTSMGF